MSVTPKEISKLATLSRLSFTDEAQTKFISEFDNILKFVEKIQEARTGGVPPLATTAGATTTPERADEVTEINRRDSYQQTAPIPQGASGRAVEQGFYVVPKIVE